MVQPAALLLIFVAALVEKVFDYFVNNAADNWSFLLRAYFWPLVVVPLNFLMIGALVKYAADSRYNYKLPPPEEYSKHAVHIVLFLIDVIRAVKKAKATLLNPTVLTVLLFIAYGLFEHLPDFWVLLLLWWDHLYTLVRHPPGLSSWKRAKECHRVASLPSTFDKVYIDDIIPVLGNFSQHPDTFFHDPLWPETSSWFFGIPDGTKVSYYRCNRVTGQSTLVCQVEKRLIPKEVVYAQWKNILIFPLKVVYGLGLLLVDWKRGVQRRVLLEQPRKVSCFWKWGPISRQMWEGVLKWDGYFLISIRSKWDNQQAVIVHKYQMQGDVWPIVSSSTSKKIPSEVLSEVEEVNAYTFYGDCIAFYNGPRNERMCPTTPCLVYDTVKELWHQVMLEQILPKNSNWSLKQEVGSLTSFSYKRDRKMKQLSGDVSRELVFVTRRSAMEALSSWHPGLNTKEVYTLRTQPKTLKMAALEVSLKHFPHLFNQDGSALELGIPSRIVEEALDKKVG